MVQVAAGEVVQVFGEVGAGAALLLQQQVGVVHEPPMNSVPVQGRTLGRDRLSTHTNPSDVFILYRETVERKRGGWEESNIRRGLKTHESFPVLDPFSLRLGVSPRFSHQNLTQIKGTRK